MDIIENVAYDFEPIVGLDSEGKIKDYDGFIDPEGNFYKVSKIYKHKPTHEDWAFYYLTEKSHKYIDDFVNASLKESFKLNKYKDSQALLLHFYNWVYVGHAQNPNRGAIIVFPKDNEENITREQKVRLEDYFGFDKYSSYMEKTNGHSYVDGETYDRFSTYAQFNEGLFGNQLSNKMRLLIEKIFGLEKDKTKEKGRRR